MTFYLKYLALVLALPFLSGMEALAQPYERVAGEILIQFRGNLASEELLQSPQEHASGIGIPAPWVIDRQLSRRPDVRLVKYDTLAIEGDQLLRQLRAHPSVLHAQYNHIVSFRATPNDPEFNKQWSLLNPAPAPAPDINMQKAWELSTGGLTSTGDTIVVGAVDGGVDIHHNDLKPNMWKNYGEIPNNGIDDDGNGFVDDFNGWDFIFQSDSIYKDFHGTSIAGIIGAKGNNGIGISGVNWDLKMLPVGFGGLTESMVIQVLSYVLDFRVKYNATNGQDGYFVIAVNGSWGIDNAVPDSFPIWCGMYDTLGAHGILSIASTMNKNDDVDLNGDMPTGCKSPYLITVTATTKQDNKVGSAAYGVESIDLGAPGQDIYSTRPGNLYGNFSGTSFAAPLVTGAVALMYSAACPDLMADAVQYPDSVARAIKRFILEGTDPVIDLDGRTVSGGRLNVYRSLLLTENYGKCELASIGDGGPGAGANQQGIIGLYPNPASTSVTITYTNLEPGNNRFILTNTLGQDVLVLDDDLRSRGEHSFTLPVGHLPAGVYYVRIASGFRQSSLQKLVIQR